MRNRVRECRRERGWSQEALAQRLGVSRQSVHAIENDRSDPGLALSFTIARLFGRRIEDIFQPDR